MGNDPESGDQGGASEQLGSPTTTVEADSGGVGRSTGADDELVRSNSKRTFGVFQQLNANEKVTALLALGTTFVSIGSLVVSALTYLNAANTSDLKSAVGHLAALADQTKRQADEAKRNADILSGQLDILRQQVGESKRQTKEISKQTDAIVTNAKANIKSADAQKRAADAEVDMRTGRIAFSTINIGGITDKSEVNGRFKVTLSPVFENIGNSEISDPINYFVFYAGSALPERPEYSKAVPLGGNGITLASGQAFSPSGPITYEIDSDMMKAIDDHKFSMFIYGYITFIDSTHVSRRFCYAYQIAQSKNGVIYWERGGPAYHCSG